MDKLSGTISGISTLTGGLSDQLSMTSGVVTIGVPLYSGTYEFTPTQTTQTIAIMGQMASQNITINPIPSNYGLVTWNGVELHIS